MKTKQPNLDYLNAVPILLKEASNIQIILAGCGGTGGWLSLSIAQIGLTLRKLNFNVSVLFVDPDVIETKNILRQNFTLAEVGLPKAHSLALRYNGAWALDIAAVQERFDSSMVEAGYKTLSLIVACVDNAQGRKSIAHALDQINGESSAPSVWAIDCGNAVSSGQVLLGCTSSPRVMQRFAFTHPGIIGALPAPTWQAPDLLIPRPEELDDTPLSCTEIANRNLQSVMVNKFVAVIAGEYINSLLVTRKIKHYATYFNLPSCNMVSKYITPEEMAPYCQKTAT